MIEKHKKLLLAVIFALGLLLRVWKLNEFPAGLNADEAAIGYNAYSLIETGKDEFGNAWPINFQSFNDFKPGLYFYLVLPLVKILGLNEWSVRLPSAILGGLSLLLVYGLVYEIFKEKHEKTILALISSLILAVSPWSLHFSRGGWETNTALFFMLAGVYFFLLGINKNAKYYLLSVISISLSMFTYHSARVVSPLLISGAILLFRKNISFKANKKYLSASILVGIFFMVILLKSMTGQAGSSRFSGVGIFADQGPFWRVNELRGQHSNPFSVFPKVVHNKYFEYAVLFFDNYLRHFSGNYLFVTGDEIQRNRIPETGQFFLLLFPFLVLGTVFSIKNIKDNGFKLIFWWLIVSPVASSLTFQSPHAIRSLNMVIPLTIIISCGIFDFSKYIFDKFPKTISKISLIIFISLLSWFFFLYLHQYYVHYPQKYPYAWEYGFSPLADYLKNNYKKYDKVYITNRYDQPYILLAFYLRYPPSEFQKQAKLNERDRFGFSTVESFANFHFGEINYNILRQKGNSLIVGTPEEIPDSATIVKVIYFKDGKQEAFRIVEN